ncbi:hypothetical protein BFO_1584 [Tannerella forsythia 92A2]|uniref:Uncharacterized protein n=1 Tax=Tannerella forsythia (strain ATCC 43037 / JCM 10827 / CCUG 21028 A / KCTC 5666 / FDC 338) TaxID=203275 RepID=G8UM27_TANFA|nr:hypothetical protein BFO_1584 [Tannerella forsythia 92A2]
MHIKAGNCSSSVHNYFFKFFPSKIVKLWLRTRKGGDRKQSVGLVFLSDRCKISRILSKFAVSNSLVFNADFKQKRNKTS